MKTKHVVALIHGIRTYGHWQERAKSILEQDEEFKAIPIRYGYFDIFRFLTPIPIVRNAPIKKVLKQIRSIEELYPNAKFSIVAHSFGTYSISQILLTEPDIRFHRIIFCGSVVSDNYRWWLVSNSFDSPLRNDCSHLDIWPAFAKAITWGFGTAGTFGIANAVAENRFQELKHSDYFKGTFIENYWKPFLKDGILEPPTSPQTRGVTAWWWRLILALVLIVRWIAIPALVSIIVLILLNQPDVAKVNEVKWFPSQEVLERIKNDINSGELDGIADYTLRSSSRHLLREIQLHYDNKKLSLYECNANIFIRVFLPELEQREAVGYWMGVTLIAPGENPNVIWDRTEVTGPELRIPLRNLTGWAFVKEAAATIEMPEDIIQLLERLRIGRTNMEPKILLAILRDQWEFIPSKRTGGRWLTLEITRVSAAVCGDSLERILIDPRQIPDSNLSTTWFELEMEERGPAIEEQSKLSLYTRLEGFRTQYGLDNSNFEGSLVPKYQNALARLGMIRTKEQ
jgi:pimeloyl-ACP methyl ester carboxylesterase